MFSADHTTRLELAPLPEAAGRARRHLRQVLRAWGVPRECAASAELVVSELVTNAVQHGTAGLVPDDPRRVTVTLRRMDTHLLIEVLDESEHPPATGGAVSWESESGRGLFLVEQVAKQWSFYLPPTGGKVVWCEIALGPALVEGV